MGYLARVGKELVGNPVDLPEALTESWPELVTLRFRRGGLPLRIGGWLLGQATVAAITLGRTIFLAPATRFDPELLLHELRHVQQFSERRSFPLRYIWESLRRGYHANRYEADARSYAARRLARATGSGSEEDA
ncbi:MAG: DUF4157 domain-containing protein [Gemmatimonadaceae bacterium]|nr:DUF4157 domain-containing protein [Gemmatimonadaceae bacterium]